MSYEDDCNEYYFGIPFKKRVSAAAPAEQAQPAMPPKFKVGDWVRVVKMGHGGSLHGAAIGDVDIVRDVVDDGVIGETNWYFLPNEIELVVAHPFTVGDRVKLKRHFGSHACGDEGDVVHLATKAGFNNATAAMEPWGVYSEFPVECLALVSAADCAVRKEQPASEPVPKFKAGDVVSNSWSEHTIRCVKTHYTKPLERSKYIGPVAYDYVDGGWDCESDITLVLAADCPQDNVQQPMPACPPSLQPAIVARVVDGQPRPSNIPFVHANSGAALQEAARLACNNPGQEFAVYQRVGARVCEAQTTYNMKEVA